MGGGTVVGDGTVAGMAVGTAVGDGMGAGGTAVGGMAAIGIAGVGGQVGAGDGGVGADIIPIGRGASTLTATMRAAAILLVRRMRAKLFSKGLLSSASIMAKLMARLGRARKARLKLSKPIGV